MIFALINLSSALHNGRCVNQWRRKLENFEGDGVEKIGVKGGYPLENSLVLVH